MFPYKPIPLPLVCSSVNGSYIHTPCCWVSIIPSNILPLGRTGKFRGCSLQLWLESEGFHHFFSTIVTSYVSWDKDTVFIFLETIYSLFLIRSFNHMIWVGLTPLTRLTQSGKGITFSWCPHSKVDKGIGWFKEKKAWDLAQEENIFLLPYTVAKETG